MEHMGVSLKAEVPRALRNHHTARHLSKQSWSFGGHLGCPELRSSFLHTRCPVRRSTHLYPNFSHSFPFLSASEWPAYEEIWRARPRPSLSSQGEAWARLRPRQASCRSALDKPKCLPLTCTQQKATAWKQPSSCATLKGLSKPLTWLYFRGRIIEAKTCTFLLYN